MFKRLFFVFSLLAVLFSVKSVRADEPNYPKKLDLGFGLSAGVPEGAALTVVARPWTRMLRVEGGMIYSTNFGVLGGLTFDPMPFPVGLTATVEGGTVFTHNLPSFVQSMAGNTVLPAVGYDYANLHLGLEFGSRKHFRFYIHGGESFLNIRTQGFQNTVNSAGGSNSNVSVGDPYAHIWAPSAKLGFILVW